MKLLSVALCIFLVSRFSLGQQETAWPAKKCEKQEKSFDQSTSLFTCLNCLADLSFNPEGETAKSEKWLTLLSIMASSCPEGAKTADQWKKSADLLQKFGFCAKDSYEFAKDEKSEENAENGQAEQLQTWVTGQSPLKYTDAPATQELFQKIFDLSYSTAFFYFCQLPSIPPLKKVERLGRYHSYVGENFRQCASEAANQLDRQNNRCALYQLLAPAAEAKDRTLFLSAGTNSCTVAFELHASEKEKTIYQFTCDPKALPSTTAPADDKEKEEIPQKNLPGYLPTEYPK